MKIVVVGTRGIPEIQGGVETHCQELYPRLVAMGHDVTVIRRSPYVNAGNAMDTYKGVKLIDVYAPRKKSFEAIVHTFLALLKARSLHPDIVHVHAVGPSLLIPMARLLGMRTVMTNHGPDYDRQKWGRLAKRVLRSGERLGSKWSNSIIVISDVIRNIVATNYGRTDSHLIFNGVNVPATDTSTDFISSLGLESGRYVVAMGRFVEEKGFHDLIHAFAKASPRGYRLAIAGDADHPDDYSTRLKQLARQHDVALTGFIRGRKLAQLMTNAALFAMPSYHEGLPIALLEALSYRLPVIVSDIPANRIAPLAPTDFFSTGSVDDLASALTRRLASPPGKVDYDLTDYDWDRIAAQTADVYRFTLHHPVHTTNQ